MSAKITTVTLNAAIDRAYELTEFAKGKVARAERVVSTAGGKGINVARVLRRLGHADIVATGFVGGSNGKFITDRVRETGIVPDFVEVEGESRFCLNLLDRSDGSSTEVLEPGPEIGPEALEAFKRKLQGLAAESAAVIMSGSLPRGAPATYYAELAAIARGAGAEVLLDTSGAALLQGLAGGPSFIKPNEDEIGPLLGGLALAANAERDSRGGSSGGPSGGLAGGSSGRLAGGSSGGLAGGSSGGLAGGPSGGAGYDSLRAGVAALLTRGIPSVVVTLGAEGAVAGVGGEFYRVAIPRLQAVNTVGSGDAFVAGYAYGLVRGWPAAECLRYGAAAGCANALSPLTGDVNPDEHRRILAEVRAEIWL